MFTANISDAIKDKDLSKDVYMNGSILGYSDEFNTCYWICYKYNDKFYIGINSNDYIWEVTEQDIMDYNDNPTL